MDHDQPMRPSQGPRACRTCAKAKSRCIPGPAEGICERCHRLKKTCSAQTPAPPRKRKTPRPTRVAELEKKLEDLTARVGARQNAPPPPTSEGTSPADIRTPEGRTPPPAEPQRGPCPWRVPGPQSSFGYIFALDSQTSQPDIQGLPRSATDSGSESPAPPRSLPEQQQVYTGSMLPDSPVACECLCHNKSPPTWPPGDEAEQLLDDYRVHMEPLFPFVVVPRSMTSDQLRHEKPLLWNAVMSQALCMDPSRQVPMGDKLLNDVIAACFFKPRKSIDLVQALEVLLAWFHVKLHSFQITNMLFLLRSICVSLGFSESQDPMKQQEHTSASLEQMRTFAGVYYLVTMVFTTNKKLDAFMSTSYLEACCGALSEKMEYSTDELAVYLIRTQQLAQSISITLAFRSTDLPLSIIIKSFREQIDQLRTSIPQHIKEYAAIRTQLHIAEILLYEIGINEEASATLALTDRLELLWECLKATRSMLEARFEKPKGELPQYTYLSIFDYTYAMLTCLKLSTLHATGWDLQIVRKELVFDHFLEKQIQEVKHFMGKRTTAIKRNRGCANMKQLLGTMDQFERLYMKLSMLQVSLRAEMDSAVRLENSGETAQAGLADSGTASAAVPGAGMAVPQALLPQALPHVLMQDLDGSSWQNICGLNEGETDLDTLSGWGAGDISWYCGDRPT